MTRHPPPPQTSSTPCPPHPQVEHACTAGAAAKAITGRPGKGGAKGKGKEAEGEEQGPCAGDAREDGGGARKKYSYKVEPLEDDDQDSTSAWTVTVRSDGEDDNGVEFIEHKSGTAGSTVCLITQETLKGWFEFHYRWEMTAFEWGEDDERGNKCFFAAFRKPATEHSPERPSPLTLPRDDIIFPAQWRVALEIAERIRRVYSKSWSELAQDFCKVDFCIFTANLNTVADQTFNRVMKRQLCGQESSEKTHKCRVLRYSKDKNVKTHFENFKKRVEERKKTLFVLIADECHWGAIKDGPHDKYVHDRVVLFLGLTNLGNFFFRGHTHSLTLRGGLACQRRRRRRQRRQRWWCRRVGRFNRAFARGILGISSAQLAWCRC
jgi:hypothetical protein